ncbi:MAG: hypothetical protein QGH40_10685, partial [bacterium]|nr:hypothetical protein [bacterium]
VVIRNGNKGAWNSNLGWEQTIRNNDPAVSLTVTVDDSSVHAEWIRANIAEITKGGGDTAVEADNWNSGTGTASWYTIQAGTPLGAGDGTNVAVTVTVTDDAGNVTEYNATPALGDTDARDIIIVDNTAPVVQSVVYSPVSPVNHTNNTTLTVLFDEQVTALPVVKIDQQGTMDVVGDVTTAETSQPTQSTTYTNDYTSTYFYDVIEENLPTYQDGQANVWGRATDLAGNDSGYVQPTGAGGNFIIDTKPTRITDVTIINGLGNTTTIRPGDTGWQVTAVITEQNWLDRDNITADLSQITGNTVEHVSLTPNAELNPALIGGGVATTVTWDLGNIPVYDQYPDRQGITVEIYAVDNAGLQSDPYPALGDIVFDSNSPNMTVAFEQSTGIEPPGVLTITVTVNEDLDSAPLISIDQQGTDSTTGNITGDVVDYPVARPLSWTKVSADNPVFPSIITTGTFKASGAAPSRVTITGTVQTAAGLSVQGALVTAMSTGATPVPLGRDMDGTASGGGFSLTVPASTAYTLSIQTSGAVYANQAVNTGSTSSWTSPASGSQVSGTFEASGSGVSVTGTVQDVWGNGIPGADVVAMSTGATPVVLGRDMAGTAIGGGFSLTVPASTSYKLEIQAQGSVIASPAENTATIATWTSPASGTQAAGTFQATEAGLAVTGMVQDSGGNAIQCAVVTAMSTGGSPTALDTDLDNTDADGLFELTVPAGTAFTIKIQAQGMSYSNPAVNTTSISSWTSPTSGMTAVVYLNDTFHMWFSWYRSIFYATSADGANWSLVGESITPGARGGGGGAQEVYSVSQPTVVWNGTQFRAYYTGRATVSGDPYLHTATSADGMTWTKYGSAILAAKKSEASVIYEAGESL